MNKLAFREAQEDDCALILHFIKKLAAHGGYTVAMRILLHKM